MVRSELRPQKSKRLSSVRKSVKKRPTLGVKEILYMQKRPRIIGMPEVCQSFERDLTSIKRELIISSKRVLTKLKETSKRDLLSSKRGLIISSKRDQLLILAP